MFFSLQTGRASSLDYNTQIHWRFGRAQVSHHGQGHHFGDVKSDRNPWKEFHKEQRVSGSPTDGPGPGELSTKIL